MDKIVIIGSSGAGKSTFARALGSILNIRAFHLDRLLWQYDWKGRTEDARREILENLIVRRKKQWVIEGNYLRFSKIHVDTADTIIFLDVPPLVCGWHLLKRHWEYYKCSRYDIPVGCTDRLTFKRMWKALTFRFHGRRTIEQMLDRYEHKNIIRLHSVKEIEEFLALQEKEAGNKANSSRPVSSRRERILAPIR